MKLVENNTTHSCNLSADEDVEKEKKTPQRFTSEHPIGARGVVVVYLFNKDRCHGSRLLTIFPRALDLARCVFSEVKSNLEVCAPKTNKSIEFNWVTKRFSVQFKRRKMPYLCSSYRKMIKFYLLIWLVHKLRLQHEVNRYTAETKMWFTVKMWKYYWNRFHYKQTKELKELSWIRFYGRDEAMSVSNCLPIWRTHFKNSRANDSNSSSKSIGWVTDAVRVGFGVDAVLALGFGEAFLLDRNDFCHEQQTKMIAIKYWIFALDSIDSHIPLRQWLAAPAWDCAIQHSGRPPLPPIHPWFFAEPDFGPGTSINPSAPHPCWRAASEDHHVFVSMLHIPVAPWLRTQSHHSTVAKVSPSSFAAPWFAHRLWPISHWLRSIGRRIAGSLSPTSADWTKERDELLDCGALGDKLGAQTTYHSLLVDDWKTDHIVDALLELRFQRIAFLHLQSDFRVRRCQHFGSVVVESAALTVLGIDELDFVNQCVVCPSSFFEYSVVAFLSAKIETSIYRSQSRDHSQCSAKPQ